MILALLILAVLLLSWGNGANDNFKGVATLYGSATTTYRQALVWATAATMAGSLVSVVFSRALIKTFGGYGMVPESLIQPRFLSSVALAAAITVLLATRLGMPASTTHALTGALVGAGVMGAGIQGIGWERLVVKFAQPLLLSPLIAIGVTVLVYPLASRAFARLGLRRESCLCIGSDAQPQTIGAVGVGAAGVAAQVATPTAPQIRLGHSAECGRSYVGRFFGIQAQSVIDATHYLSGGAVCFARAVNDTPKIAALVLAASALGSVPANGVTLTMVATAMALGGWVHSRRVAETMSKGITELSPGQGLTANLMTATVVLGASRLGVPVSTTHVSCGSIFGIGVVRGNTRWRTVLQILTAWVTTLPFAAALGAGAYLLISVIFPGT